MAADAVFEEEGEEVTGAKQDRPLASIRRGLCASYHVNGRWVCRMDQRSGQWCEGCGSVIRSVRPGETNDLFSPSCHR